MQGVILSEIWRGIIAPDAAEAPNTMLFQFQFQFQFPVLAVILSASEGSRQSR